MMSREYAARARVHCLFPARSLCHAGPSITRSLSPYTPMLSPSSRALVDLRALGRTLGRSGFPRHDQTEASFLAQFLHPLTNSRQVPHLFFGLLKRKNQKERERERA